MASPIPVFMPLAAGRAVDMSRIPQQEHAAVAEVLRDPVMHAIGREPVDLAHLNLHVRDRVRAHIFKLQTFRMRGALVANGADQSRAPGALQRKHRQKVRLIKVDLQFTVNGGTFGIHVRNVEHLLVGAARKLGADALAHAGARAITAGRYAASQVSSCPFGARSSAVM